MRDSFDRIHTGVLSEKHRASWGPWKRRMIKKKISCSYTVIRTAPSHCIPMKNGPLERGMKLEDLHVVEIPRKLYAEGTIQDVREYVAQYLEAKDEA